MLQMCKLNTEHKKLYDHQYELREILRWVVKKDTNLAMCCREAQINSIEFVCSIDSGF